MAEDSPVTQRRQHGHSRAYIIDRLKRENRTVLAAAVEAGTVSAFAAAVQCGWTKRPPTLAGTTPQARRRQLRLEAIADGGTNLGRLGELWLGPLPDGSLFSDPASLRAAWEQNKSEVMRLFATGGHRPQAWWCFEAPALGLTWPGYFSERSYLYEHNALSEEERIELERFWRHEFERSYRPHFFHTAAPGEILHGVRARRAHYRWADIPDELVERWQAERRPRRRQLAPLEEAAAIK